MIHYSLSGNELTHFCEQIGGDRLLVQGGGGNASWKEDNTLWVKASGTRLSDARQKQIFVPVDLKPIQIALQANNFSLPPIAANGGTLCPSIETLLHALMPQKYVLHLHAIDPLATLVEAEPYASCEANLPSEITWCLVDYHKPGADLAAAVANTRENLAAIDLVLMSNHGIILAADSIYQLDWKLKSVIEALKRSVRTIANPNQLQKTAPNVPQPFRKAYQWSNYAEINSLAIDPTLLEICKTNWVLYPDHAVFLGRRAAIFVVNGAEEQTSRLTASAPDFILVEGKGVLTSDNAKVATVEQLLCYADVLLRLNDDKTLNALDDNQISELLDWDAEKYRQVLASRYD